MNTADALCRTLESPNVVDSNWERANVVDVLNHISNSTNQIAKAITPTEALAGQDATGGRVKSLTEAVMGLTAAMVQIAGAIGELAESVRESGGKE